MRRYTLKKQGHQQEPITICRDREESTAMKQLEKRTLVKDHFTSHYSNIYMPNYPFDTMRPIEHQVTNYRWCFKRPSRLPTPPVSGSK